MSKAGLKNIGSYTFFIGMIFSLLGCKQVSNTEENPTSSEEIEERGISVSFPVYNYDGLEPLLNSDDDALHIINFWATWCKPCVEEMPYFEKVYSLRKSDSLSLTYVSLDMPQMWDKQLPNFVNKNQLMGAVVILDDPKMNEWIPKVHPEWSGGIPATLIYKANHRIFREGGYTYDQLLKTVDSIHALSR